MISGGSCDTEDWSNDAENSALITGINLHFTIYSNRSIILNSNNISQYYCFYCSFEQINAALVSQRYYYSFYIKHFIFILFLYLAFFFQFLFIMLSQQLVFIFYVIVFKLQKQFYIDFNVSFNFS